MSISQHSIDALLQTVDIVDVIGSYIDLKKNGSNYVGRCPFHDEKTPSFAISPSKGFYHCFGCGVGGNVIRFVMEYEKLGFVESVEKVAAMCNFTLEYEQNYMKQTKSVLLEEVMRFFQKNLLNHKPSLEYLASRQVANTSIEKFRIGYCGASFELLKFLNTNQLDKQEALELGVIGREKDREYARMNNRITFPIHSPNGRVVGFGGRTMNDSNAKYLNSPQSKIFNKSKLLYGYYIAKEHIYKQKKIIVCEGYLDVIMLHQAGFECAVATLGTALTGEHLPLLRKGEPKVILSYDSDSAGINAAFKAARMLAGNSIEGGVVIFDNGLDPADMVAQKRVEELAKLFSEPMPFVEFVFSHIISQFKIQNPLEKEKALKASTQFLHTLSPVLQESYKPLLARKLSLPERLIKSVHKRDLSAIYQTQDIAESILIKTLLEHRDFIDVAIEYIDDSLFLHYRNEFIQLCRQHYDESSLIGIMINPHIKSLDSIDALKEHLRLFIMRKFSQNLAQIPTNNTIDVSRKQEIIKIIKRKITQLKKGELLPYVSISTL